MYKKYKVLFSSLIIFLSLSFLIGATLDYPQPTNLKYINDYVGIVNEDDTKSILSIGKELEDKTGSQVTIVIIDSTNGIPIEDYSVNLFRTWGIGQSKKDNGLLILLALQDKRWRVEVGRGLEGAIPDALSNRVMETIAKPQFQESNYSIGLRDAYSSFCDIIAKEYNITLEKSLNIQLPSTENSSKGFGSISLIIIFISLVALDVLFNRGRIFSTLLNLIFWSNLSNRRGGGSSNGGGFGGFGGGSSNGGGSSGSW